jgi:enoyl-CoA hydratase/carnithine racemase
MSPSSQSPFTVRQSASVLHLEFSIPSSSNALSLDAARVLRGVVREFRAWRGLVVVTSAHRSIFCSGGNLSDYARLKGKAPGLKINREITACLDAFGNWPAVKLAVIEGDVLGGGMEWLARFDYRWSTPSAVFAFWQRRIGLSTGWGGGKAWAAKIGEENVRRLLMEGSLLSAETALRLGLVDRVVSSWRIRGEAEVHSVSGKLSDWSAARESKIFSSLWMSHEHRAVLEKWKRKR